MKDNFKRLEQYFDPRVPLQGHMERLGDKSQFPNHLSKGVNEAVMAFTVKYLLDYLQIITSNIEVIRRGVRKLVENLNAQNGQMMFNPQRNLKTDAFAVQCLADVHSTAAIVTEIALGIDHSSPDQQFMASDLGTGTGILLAAAVIRGMRRKASSICAIGFDSQANAVANATRIFQKMPRVQTHMHQMDIAGPEPYNMVAAPVFPDYWISETINTMTPAMTVTEKSMCVGANEQMSMMLGRNTDSFVNVMANLLRLPYVYRKIKERSSEMFPNIITGAYVPDGQGGMLALQTASNPTLQPLKNVGDDFRNEFEGFCQSRRWH